LRLPEKGLVVLAGADSLKDRRKGFDLLREAWKSGSFHDATLALFGRHGESRPGEQYLGNLNSDEELVAAYRAADLYVHPARMENAPCTIQESLACGTPVVAFAIGGIPEMIRRDETGFLAESVNSTSLATTLEKALKNPQRLAQMASACRKYAEKDFDLATQVASIFQMSLGFSR
jgi:glycosyltransferase involved in cell wall biosynthesis